MGLNEKKIVRLSGKNPFDRSSSESQMCYDRSVIDLLSDVIDIPTYLIKTPLITDLKRYEINPNSWIVEQLVNGSAEMSSTTLVLTPEPETLVRYSIAVGSFRPQMYYKAQSIRMASNIYFVPFTFDTWIALLCTLLIITAVLTYILARESRLPHETPYDLIARIADEKHDQGVDWNAIDIHSTSEATLLKREHWEIGEIILVAIGAMCQQGFARDPNTAAARTLQLALLVLAVLVFTAYSASVISLISLLPNTERESDFGRLPPRDVPILLQDTNFFMHNFDLEKRKANYSNLREGLTEAMNGRAVFIAEKDSSLAALHRFGFTAELRCGLGRALWGLEHQRVFAFRNDSPIYDKVNFNILRLRQFGLLSREKHKHFNHRRPCSAQERFALSGFTSVDLSDVKPVLQLVIWGWIISLIVVVVEFIIYYCLYEIEKIFSEQWKSKEDQAGRTLQLWLRRRLYEKFERNRGLVAKE